MQCDAARLGELNSVRATRDYCPIGPMKYLNVFNAPFRGLNCGLVSCPRRPELPHVSSFRDTEGPGERGELSKHWGVT